MLFISYSLIERVKPETSRSSWSNADLDDARSQVRSGQNVLTLSFQPMTQGDRGSSYLADTYVTICIRQREWCEIWSRHAENR